MGERYDVLVTLGDGAFPLVASAEGKTGQGLAVVRTAAGPLPAADVAPLELTRTVRLGSDLRAAPEVRLRRQGVDRTHDLVLGGSMAGYRWTINGKTFDEADLLEVRQGERVRLWLRNMTMMFHPMHVHGHTFGLRVTGRARTPSSSVPCSPSRWTSTRDNPGQWVTAAISTREAGMMTTLSYRA